MTFQTDILGRAPIMRPGARGVQDLRPVFRCEDVQGRTVVHVPYPTTNSGSALTSPVTLPAMPWERTE